MDRDSIRPRPLPSEIENANALLAAYRHARRPFGLMMIVVGLLGPVLASGSGLVVAIPELYPVLMPLMVAAWLYGGLLLVMRHQAQRARAITGRAERRL